MSNSFPTPWVAAHQAPLSMGFPRQEYWNGLLFPSPGDLPNPGVKPASPAMAGRFFTTEPPRKPNGRDNSHYNCFYMFPKETNKKRADSEDDLKAHMSWKPGRHCEPMMQFPVSFRWIFITHDFYHYYTHIPEM